MQSEHPVRNICDLTDWTWAVMGVVRHPLPVWESVRLWSGLTCSGQWRACSSATWSHICAWSPWSGWPNLVVSPAPLCSPTSGTGSVSLAAARWSVDTSADVTLVALLKQKVGSESARNLQGGAELPSGDGSSCCGGWNWGTSRCFQSPLQCPQLSSSPHPSKTSPMNKNWRVCATD